MKISVVVPFFNEEKHIESCIAALTGQSYPKDQYEIILVDNNSTDQSATIARRNPEVRVVLEEVQGDYAARNRGIAESTGDIIAFTDADTAPREDWLSSIDQSMRDSGTLVLVGRLHFSSASGSLAMLAAYESDKMEWIFDSKIEDLYVAYTCNMATRRTVFEQLGGFPLIYRSADIVFLRRAIDLHSSSAVRYDASIEADRLEISTLRQYYSKLHTYGRDYAQYSRKASLRALSNLERLRIFRQTIDRNDYSLVAGTLLLVLLLIGGICYDTGRILGPSS
ncbi:MAG: glycosyltransferase [Rhodothermales bacterium]|nr:glycosyltransferase [Rhodothermales bacterium]